MERSEQADNDIILKFDGATVRQQKGAPAESVIAALNALQRMAYLIGIKNEGRAFGHRAKPSTRVRRDYAVICRHPEEGSHVQPFDLGSLDGNSAAALAARAQLLDTLKAFDTGDASRVERLIPDARERWFLAEAASGLIPPEDSGIQLTIRPGYRGPFAFSAERARNLVKSLRAGEPPQPGITKVAGRLDSVDYKNMIAFIKPIGKRFKINYSSIVEPMVQANARKRMIIIGRPSMDGVGDVIGFDKIDKIEEVEGVIVTKISAGKSILETSKPIRFCVSFDFEEKIFSFSERSLGVDLWSEDYHDIVSSLERELVFLWRNYAQTSDDELDLEARALKKSLRARFGETEDAA